jgi:hypothetical protein
MYLGLDLRLNKSNGIPFLSLCSFAVSIFLPYDDLVSKCNPV